MIRTMMKLVLVVIVIVGLAFLLGRWNSGSKIVPGSPVHAAGPVDTSKAREAGAKVGEATAKAANEAAEALANGAITAKIKSKMVLDDLVKARNIGVDTNGAVVTLTGVRGAQAERQRAHEPAEQNEAVRA